MELPFNTTRKKTCKQCGFIYWSDDIDIAFRQVFARHASQKYLRPVCRLCEQDKRTEKIQGNRWKPKVINTRRTHSRKLGISIKALEASYGWIPDVMAHDAAHGYANGCPECHALYEIMGNGLRDITLDIWDPSVEPTYGVNTRWICSTCNSAKRDMPPSRWAAYKRLWRERGSYLAEQAIIPQPKQLELF